MSSSIIRAVLDRKILQTMSEDVRKVGNSG